MKEYVLLLGANQYLRERALSGAKSVTHLPIWSADVDPSKLSIAILTILLKPIRLTLKVCWSPLTIIALKAGPHA